MRAVRGILDSDVAHDEEQTAKRAVQRAFDTARARAAVLAQDDRAGGPQTPARGQRTDRRAKLRAALEQDERDVARLRARIRTATAGTRPALEREWVAASNQRELRRVRLDFVTKLEQFTSEAAAEEADLTNQIQALQDAVPELTSPSAASTVVTSPRAGSPSGVWTLVYHLLALQRSRGSLKDLRGRTTGIIQSTDAEVQATRGIMRPVLVRLRTLAKDPAVRWWRPTASASATA